MKDEFYIGYLDRGPTTLAGRTRRWVIGLACGWALLVVGLAVVQRRAEPGRFEFGETREFTGVLGANPIPRLRVVGPDGMATNYLLVGAGKFGLPDYARGHAGEEVRFRGTLIEKGSTRMIEMNDAKSFVVLRTGSSQGAAAGAPEAGRVEPLGSVNWTGELVDTKCWLGVMRPGAGKVHRACAVRCLSGGVPPGLLLRDGRGDGVVVLLAGPNGERAQVDPQWAGRELTVEGILELLDGTPVLRLKSCRLASGR
jgi:hypothetical protein